MPAGHTPVKSLHWHLEASVALQKPAQALLTTNPNAPPGAVCNEVREKKPS